LRGAAHDAEAAAAEACFHSEAAASHVIRPMAPAGWSRTSRP
jgi:hypothetical protein